MRKYIAGNNPDIAEQQQDCATSVGRFVEAECMAVDDTSNDCASSHSAIWVIWMWLAERAMEEHFVSVTSAANV